MEFLERCMLQGACGDSAAVNNNIIDDAPSFDPSDVDRLWLFNTPNNFDDEKGNSDLSTISGTPVSNSDNLQVSGAKVIATSDSGTGDDVFSWAVHFELPVGTTSTSVAGVWGQIRDNGTTARQLLTVKNTTTAPPEFQFFVEGSLVGATMILSDALVVDTRYVVVFRYDKAALDLKVDFAEQGDSGNKQSFFQDGTAPSINDFSDADWGNTSGGAYPARYYAAPQLDRFVTDDETDAWIDEPSESFG